LIAAASNEEAHDAAGATTRRGSRPQRRGTTRQVHSAAQQSGLPGMKFPEYLGDSLLVEEARKIAIRLLAGEK